MSEQKNNIPLVRLGDVAKWLRPGDRFHYRDNNSGHGGECCITKVSENWVSCTGAFLGVRVSHLVTLLSPRLEPVPVGAIVKAGTPYAYLDGSEWTEFDPVTWDFANPSDDCDCYQLVRDEPEQLPREVVAGPETLRAGDEVEFVRLCDGLVVDGWLGPNSGAPYTVTRRGSEGWHLTGFKWVVDDDTVRLLSRANQDPPAAEAQPEPVTKPERPSACCFCEQPFGPYRRASKNPHICADCRPGNEPLDARIATARRELAESAPDPHAHLTPAQRYHLDDDADASGIPEHH